MTNRQDSRFARLQVARRVAHTDVRHELQRFEDDVGGAISIWRLDVQGRTNAVGAGCAGTANSYLTIPREVIASRFSDTAGRAI